MLGIWYMVIIGIQIIIIRAPMSRREQWDAHVLNSSQTCLLFVLSRYPSLLWSQSPIFTGHDQARKKWIVCHVKEQYCIFLLNITAYILACMFVHQRVLEDIRSFYFKNVILFLINSCYGDIKFYWCVKYLENDL